MMRQYELIETVQAYDPKADEALLNRAYVFSMHAHGTQKRASGDPYFSHPIEVAGILTDYKLDCATIVTAILHDTVEDTVATPEEIESYFGEEIATLVDGVTKLSQLEFRSEESKQAENFRKLLLAMSNDIRVLLVKLADRLHNMRTLHYLKPDKRRRIALETMEIYAPLASRIGMQSIKEELEDLAFQEINPEARESIVNRLEFLRQQSGDSLQRVEDELDRTMAAAGVAAEVTGREKRASSIWRKMERYNVSFEQVSDIVGFRIVTPTAADCYRALGAVHQNYRMVPERFKDYISTPKRNNYRSIHTTVIGPENLRIEVQIRSEEMHAVADSGVAAHWHYKSQPGGETPADHTEWLRDLLEILQDGATPEEFLEHTKLEMYIDQVFCFTPAGDLIRLPRGATPVDFAYAVHTDIGHSCVGAKVNGTVVSLRYELNNGDQVDILRAKTADPNARWENFVVTGRARSAIRRFVRNQERQQYIRLGEAIAEKAFRETQHEYSKKALENSVKSLKLKDVEEVFAELGQGNLTSRELLAHVFPGEQRSTPFKAMTAINRVLPSALRINAAKPWEREKAKSAAVPIQGLIPGLAVHYADCCHPLPGDRIVGIINKGEGVHIHTIDCEQLKSVSDESDRWLDVRWDENAEDDTSHVGRIATHVVNERGSLANLARVIGNNMGNIFNLRIRHRSADYFEMVIDIEVQDVKHLTNIIAALRATPQVSTVERVRG